MYFSAAERMSARNQLPYIGIATTLLVACLDDSVETLPDPDATESADIIEGTDTGAEVTAPDATWVTFDTSSTPGTWDGLQRIELQVAPQRLAAGETFQVSCNGVDTNGIARDISPLQPVLQWQLQGASDAEPLPEDRVVVRAGEWRVSCAVETPDGRILSDNATVDVKPGPPFRHVPELSVLEVQAGETFDARCVAVDAWNNQIGTLPEPVLWDVEGALVPTEDGQWSTTISGEYLASCEQPGGSIGESARLTVNLAEPTRMLPAYAPFPSSGVVPLGNFVRPQPVFVDRWGNQGDLDDVGGTLTASVSPAAVPVSTGFRFDVEGEYEMTIRWESGSGLTFQEMTSPIRVNSFGPLVECLSPAPNERVTAEEGAPVTFQYRASDPWGVRRITVNDRDVPVDSSGLATDTRLVRHGWNAATIFSEDELGVIRATYCPFVVGEAWASEGEFVPRALYVHLGTGESDLLATVARGFSSMPDMTEFAIGVALPCEGDEAAEQCGADGQFVVQSITVGPGTSRVGITDTGELTLTHHWESVDLSSDEGIDLSIREMKFDCGITPDVNAGQLQLTRESTCRVTGTTDEPHAAAQAWFDEFGALAESWSTQATAELQTALRTLDPMGTAGTATRAALDDPRERRFNWQSRLENVAVTESTLRLEYALRVTGETVHALPPVEVPYPARPPALGPAQDAIVLGEGALWAWSTAVWRTGLLSLWFEDMLARIGSDEQPLIDALLAEVDALQSQPSAIAVSDGNLGLVFGEFQWPDTTAVLGDAYDGSLSVLFWGENSLSDGLIVNDRIWRETVFMQSSNYHVDLSVLAFFERHLRYLDPMVRVTVLPDMLPDIPEPTLAHDGIRSEFNADDGPLRWEDGYTVIPGNWIVTP